MSNNALTVENLNKIYSNSKTKKETKAITDLTFEVKEGEVFGLLGPNGAGKTTFLSILGGTVTKTSGRVNVWGFDLDKNPRQVKRRLLIAKAMVHQPPILILDEPTAGVDVELRNNLWNNVKKLNKEGVTIILTTHYLLEAQEMCDRIAILDKGNLVALDTTEKLLERIKTKKINFKVKHVDLNLQLIMKGIKFKIISKNQISATYEKNSLNFGEIINYFNKNNLKIEDISTDDGDLEDVFVQLTKH